MWRDLVRLYELGVLFLHYHLLGRHVRGQSQPSLPSLFVFIFKLNVVFYYCTIHLLNNRWFTRVSVILNPSVLLQSHSFMVCWHGELLKWNKNRWLNLVTYYKSCHGTCEEGKHKCVWDILLHNNVVICNTMWGGAVDLNLRGKKTSFQTMLFQGFPYFLVCLIYVRPLWPTVETNMCRLHQW